MIDQDGRVREHGAHSTYKQIKSTNMRNNSHWKLTENWQKDSFTTKAARKIHM